MKNNMKISALKPITTILFAAMMVLSIFLGVVSANNSDLSNENSPEIQNSMSLSLVEHINMLVLAVTSGAVSASQFVFVALGITVTIELVDLITGGTDLSATFEEGDNDHNIQPADSSEVSGTEKPAEISWFDGIYKKFGLPAFATQEYPLDATLPTGVPPGEFVAGREAVEPESYDVGQTTGTPDEIPEFTTIAIPAAAILGLMFLFNRRRRG
jgi:hypothetical protein